MFDITCFDGSIIVTKVQTYDALGQPNIEIQLASGTNPLETRLSNLEILVEQLTRDQHTELTLRQQYPALQDQFEKYQVMLGLVKESLK